MPSLSNLQLTLQRNGSDLDRDSQRRVSVSFTTNFNRTEVFAHVVYRADVILRSQGDDDPNSDIGSTRIIGTRIITSAATQVQTTITTSLHREDLNEDPDYITPNREVPAEMRDDEWVAEVRLTPHVFPTVTSHSATVIGSWGLLGQD